MDYIQFVLRVLSLLFLIIVFTLLLRTVADYIGRELRIGDLIINLFNKIVNLFKK